MKIVLVPCGAAALLLLLACGGGSNAAGAADALASSASSEADPGGPQDPGKKPIPRPRVDYETIKRLFGTDPARETVENPATPEKVALGKALYHAGIGAGGASCATCHPLGTYGTDGKAVPEGGKRNAPTTWNSWRQFRQGWDGVAASVEEFALHHALQPSGLGLGDEAKLVAAVQADAGLTKAFGDAAAVTPKAFQEALGVFLRTLSTKSKWDEYLDGNQRALGNEELLGLKTFTEVGCTTCHLTRLVGGHMYQKTGLLKPYASQDPGRALLTKSDADKFFWKVPSLANVEKTAPYYHDGKVATLDEAVTTMAAIQLDRKLTPEQHSSIVAFLKAMTGPLPADAGK